MENNIFLVDVIKCIIYVEDIERRKLKSVVADVCTICVVPCAVQVVPCIIPVPCVVPCVVRV